jgi:hypothetical protein
MEWAKQPCGGSSSASAVCLSAGFAPLSIGKAYSFLSYTIFSSRRTEKPWAVSRVIKEKKKA